MGYEAHESFEEWDRKDREWTDRIKAEHDRLGSACPCGNGKDEDDAARDR